MTLDKLRPLVDRVLKPLARGADRLGLTPNAVSVISLVIAGAAGVFFAAGPEATGAYIAGAILVALNGWGDLLDGALARRQGVSSRAGDFLDHVVDRYADIVIISGLAVGAGSFGLGFAAVTGVLMTSYLGTQTEAIGLDRTYGGLVGRADRLALIGIAAVLGAVYPAPLFGYTLIDWLLIVLAIVGHGTAFQRFFGAWREV